MKEMIERLPNLNYLVDARYPLSARAVEIFMSLKTVKNVEHRLQEAMDMSIEQHKERLLFSLMKTLGSNDSEKNLKRQKEIHAVYVASKLSNGRMKFHHFRVRFVLSCIGSAN